MAKTFGGPAANTYGTGVTDIQWLPPTRANKAKALVAIPAGFRHDALVHGCRIAAGFAWRKQEPQLPDRHGDPQVGF